MELHAMLLLAGWALTGPQAAPLGAAATTQASQCRVADCLVSPKEKADISAPESGVLMTLDCSEGDTVAENALLGVIDDRQARTQLKAAQIEHNAAKEQAESDVNVRFAIASRNVAKAELMQAEDANRKVRGAVSDAEVRRRQFGLQRAELQIEQADLELRAAQYTMGGKLAEVEAAQTMLQRRHVQAPFAGVIVEVMKDPGEWVQPGELMCRLLQLNQMWVEGFVKAEEFLPSQLSDRPVEVVAKITGAQTARFRGHVHFCSPEVDPITGLFRVKALVQNQEQGGHWLLRPGLAASMTINLTGAPPRANDAAKN